MRPAVALVVAKSPVAVRVKTRLGHEVGMERAADLAAAALLDTVGACTAAYGAVRCHLALDGVLAHGRIAGELLDAAAEWTFHPQRGADFAERLVNAHEDAAAASGAPVVQVGMDTPHLETGTLTREALMHAGARVTDVEMLRDVDEVADAESVAVTAPGTRFARTVVWTAR